MNNFGPQVEALIPWIISLRFQIEHLQTQRRQGRTSPTTRGRVRNVSMGLDVLEEVRSLLELLRGGQEDTAPEEGATTGRWFGDYDTDQDGKLSKQEALEMLKTLGQVDVAKLPADWFTSMDTNGNGFIDPEEYDKDVAKTMK
ncbi:uncharacterized protein LOC144880728 isoform X2 [Branchiostoma floridae x Branchiostoma japonicum]